MAIPPLAENIFDSSSLRNRGTGRSDALAAGGNHSQPAPFVKLKPRDGRRLRPGQDPEQREQKKMIPGRIRSRVSKLGKEHPELGEAGQLVWSVLLFRNSSSVMLDTCP
jgi:hypothetical protein